MASTSPVPPPDRRGPTPPPLTPAPAGPAGAVGAVAGGSGAPRGGGGGGADRRLRSVSTGPGRDVAAVPAGTTPAGPAVVADPPPASGAWRPGEPAGDRRTVAVGDLRLESGAVLPDVEVAYETWGRADADGGNVVLVCHALTGDSHVVGPAGEGHPTPGWWEGLVGPGLALDTDRWCVVAPNALGGCRGTTGPASPGPDGRPWGSRFPALTVRDQVAAEEALADALGIGSFALVLGGSMGGMRALEWAVCAPDRVRRVLVLAACAEASADQIAWAASQLAAVEGDPGYAGGDYHDAAPGRGPHHGLGVARRIAHATYRSADEVDARFGRRPQEGEDPARGGRFAVESYLDHHADKLVRRFDAGSYVVLTRAMNSHDVGRGRGGRARALARVTATPLVAAVSSDRLYPVAAGAALADDLPGAGPVRVIESGAGHDGFLVEVDAVGGLVRELLGRPAGPGRPGGRPRL